MIKLFTAFFILSLTVFLPKPIFADADVVINEFYALGGGSNDPDWIELYNKTDSKVDIEGWLIKDETESNKITLGGFICPHSFRKFTFSNRLNNGGDKIRLFQSGSGQAVEELTYFSQDIPSHSQGQSTGRSPDGTGSWTVFTSPTPADDTSCDTPSPTPSPTPTPTTAPVKSPSPTPKNSPSPTPKSSTPSPKKSPDSVLGEKEESQPTPTPAPTPIPSPSPKGETISKTKVAGILTGGGLVIIGASIGFFLWYQKTMRLKEEDKDKQSFSANKNA